MMTCLLIATLVYVAANAVIGFRELRSDNYESFVGYRNQAPWWLLLVSINGTFIGGGMFFATGELGYKAGLVPMVLALATALGLVGLASLAGRIRRLADSLGALTLYDVFQSRLGEGANTFLVAVSGVNVVLYFFLLAGQFLALITFLEAFGGLAHHVALTLAIGVVFLNTLVYSVVGGLKKDIWTDVFQVAVVVVAGIALLAAIIVAPGRQPLSALPPPVAPEQFGTLFVVGALLFFAPAFLVRYDLWQRVLAAKDTRAARRASLWSIPIVVGAYALFTFCGAYGRLFAAEAADGRFAVIRTMQHVLGNGAPFIVVSLGLYAAVMSSADTFLNITALSLHRLALGRDAGDRKNPQHLFQLRVLTVAACVAAGSLVLVAPSIVELMVGAFSSLVITVPAVLYVLLAKKPRSTPATASLLAGLVVFVAIFLTTPAMRTTAFVVATGLSGIVLGIVLLVSHRR